MRDQPRGRPVPRESKVLDIHVVSHTHWDREWYLPLERFRQRLVALVDELIDDPPGEGESFLLDGQAIVLEDYVRVRPERAHVLSELLRAGRLEAGPWYVLADELIPSGEALVRNLLAGQRTLARFGAGAPPVLYCPDSFGHPAALPAIGAGFGLNVIVLWRGYGSRRFPPGDAAWWRSPTGERALLYHLTRNGYELGSNLPADPPEAERRWSAMREQLAPRSTTGVILLPHGADHHARQLHHREALGALEAAGGRDTVHRSSLRAFQRALSERAGGATLPLVEGELRDSYGYTWTLQGTLATRAHEKRLNALAERALLRDAEPWNALASRRGRSRRALLDEAWRTLLEAHPHDTLCGCSIDEVAAAMEQRIRSAANQAAGVRDDAVLDLVGHDPVEARTSRDAWQPVVLLRNPAPRPRSGVAILEIEEFVADVPVGPGSAAAEIPRAPEPRRTPTVAGLGPVQVLDREKRHSRTESPRHYPDNDWVSVTRVAAWVADAPPYGVAARAIGRRSRGAAPADRVRADPRALENATLSVTVHDDGAISLLHKPTGRRISPLIRFEDDADVGDLYTPAPRPRPCDVRLGAVRRMHRGPLRGELLVAARITDPSAPRPHGGVDLSIRLILDAGASHLSIALDGNNQRDDHRLRIVLSSDVANPEVWADAAFGPVRRVPIVPSADETQDERAPLTAPLHRYVSLFGGAHGCTVFSDGLAEYESRDDGGVAVTLVRAVGELSKSDLPERPGHAGWPVPTPLAQCRGAFAANFALMLHGSRDANTVDAIERAADDILVPMNGVTLRSALRVSDVVGPELAGGGLAFSTIKESEDGRWIVLRCVNLTDQQVAGAWRLPFTVEEARLSRLDETPGGPAAVEGQAVTFIAEPRAIVTLLVR
jgi:Glycosyl hydrolases family 38 N-terminal domain/Alpha mannosidase middle domain/Glycosyl hydrolases family 38 C-terminal domain